jgi:hypothetical protein
MKNVILICKQTFPPSCFPHSCSVALQMADHINIHQKCSKVKRQITNKRACFTGPEFVKRLIIKNMMYIFTQTHVKIFTPNTLHIPLTLPLMENALADYTHIAYLMSHVSNI